MQTMMTGHYSVHYVRKQRTFDPITADVPPELLAYGRGLIDAAVPWWKIDSVSVVRTLIFII